MSADCLVEIAAERIFTENLNDERRARTGKCCVGPLHELRKIEEKDGFHLIGRRVGLRPEARQWQQREERRHRRSPHRAPARSCSHA
jgi:hypothetical protein